MPAADRRDDVRRGWLLRVTGALGLGVSAYLHAVLARGPLVLDGSLTVAGLFVGQAVVAATVAVWLLARGDRTAWLAAAVVALGSLLALLVTTYVRIPAVGPLPLVHDPLWYDDKVAAAVAAAVATGASLLALRSARRRGRAAADRARRVR